MASGVTNRGRKRRNDAYYRGLNQPAVFYLTLCTGAVTPTWATNKFSELVEIAAGNGYTTGGFSVARSTVGFPALTEDDINNRSDVRVRDCTWVATGGPLPASGDPIRWAVLTSDEATIADRDVLEWFDIGGNLTKASGESIILAGFKHRERLPVVDP